MRKALFAIASLFALTLAADEINIGGDAPAFKLVNAGDSRDVAFKPGDGKLAVVVFTCNQCPYAKAFEPRIIEVAKQYQAIAPVDPRLRFPLSRISTLVAGDHFMRMREADASDGATPNAQTDIDLMERQGPWARYRLRPATGKRHQLRVHMAALGLPILGDRIYPALAARGADDAANPLRLLAESIAFRDPVSGKDRHFASSRQLHFPLPG